MSPLPGGATETLALSSLQEHLFLLGIALVLLVLGGETFTTGIEWAGNRLGVSESATGSILAALGTTLPETLIPVIAILAGSGGSIGVGAIVGGPLALTTVGLVVIGASALYSSTSHDHDPRVVLDPPETKRDLRVFFAGYSVAVLTVFVESRWLLVTVGTVLVALYLAYSYDTLWSDGDDEQQLEELELGRLLDEYGNRMPGVDGDREYSRNPSSPVVAVQVVGSVAALVVGSVLFVRGVEWLSMDVLDVPAGLVALLVAPLVSNVPEFIEGATWESHEKDRLAVTQLTGTLAFQGTVLVAIGVLFTSWNVSLEWGRSGFLAGLSMLFALVSGGLFFAAVLLSGRRGVDPRWFVSSAAFYVLFLLVVATVVP